jgi:hypothetical protein
MLISWKPPPHPNPPPPGGRGFIGTFAITSIFNVVDSKKTGNDTVIDRYTGLIWQQDGSAAMTTWYEAITLVSLWNGRQFGGYSDWRIPTLEELATLLKPSSDENRPHMSPVFSQEKTWCWSCDIFGPLLAWRANFFNTWAETVPKKDPYSYFKAVRGTLNSHALH